MNTRLPGLAALVTALITGAGVLLVPAGLADAAPQDRATGQHQQAGRALTAAQLSGVHARQRQLLAQRRPAPTFAKAGALTFSVDTTDDTSLAVTGDTHCLDATGKCSLRAAVEAADNASQPVTILLGAHTYTLTSGAELLVSSAQGISIRGQGSGETVIAGTGASRIFEEAKSDVNASNTLLFLTDLTVTGGHADSGGGVFIDDNTGGATLVLDRVVFTANTATSSIGGGGGAIYASTAATLYATGSAFTDNTAVNGAGLWTFWANVDLRDVTVSGNHTPAGVSGGGAGWYNQYGVLRVSGGSITGNTAGDPSAFGYGAGLSDYAGNVALTGVHLDHNTSYANQGGGIYAIEDELEVTGGTISHNRVVGGQNSDGGGLFVTEGGQIDLHGVVLRGNTVPADDFDGHGGGAIYANGVDFGNQVTIDRGSRISHSDAGAIYAYASSGHVDLDIDHSVLSDNTNATANGYYGATDEGPGGCGGAICGYTSVSGAISLSLDHDTLTDNASTSTAGFGSGAIGVFSGGTDPVRVHVTRSTFDHNSAGGNGLGGAVGVWGSFDSGSPVLVRSAGNTFTRNRSGTPSDDGSGGGVGLIGPIAFADAGSTFAHNKAVGSGAVGGGLSSRETQSSRLIGSVFTRNSAGPALGGDGKGGGVYVDGDVASFTQATVAHNRSAGTGGGIALEDAVTAEVQRSTISANVAGNAAQAGLGGGIANFGGRATIENSTLTGNSVVSRPHSAGRGGAIVTGPTTLLALRFSTVSGNVARRGGGLYADGAGGSLLGSILSKNHSKHGRHGVEADCSGSGQPAFRMSSLGGNVVGQRSCVTAVQATDVVSRTPRLGPLHDNGGPTKTMALAASSPALGRADLQIPTSDQRGRARPRHHADAGAYERPSTRHRRGRPSPTTSRRAPGIGHTGALQIGMAQA